MNFDKDVLKSELPVLVDFFATWCGPCKMTAPNIEKAAKEYANTLRVLTIDVDKEPILAQSLNVDTIPTIMIFKNGEIVASHVGAMPYNQLKDFIDSSI